MVAESQILSRARGSVGNLTFCQSQWQPIVIRQKIVNPNYPNTTGQSAARDAFEWAVGQWTALAAAIREAWEHYAKSLKTDKAFGETTMTGRIAFIQSISFAKFLNTRYGLPTPLTLSAPERTGVLPTPLVRQITYTTGGNTGVKFEIENYHDKTMLVYMTASNPYNSSRNRLDGPFLYDLATSRTCTKEATVEKSFNLGIDYVSKIVFVKFRFIRFDAPFTVSRILIIRCEAETNP